MIDEPDVTAPRHRGWPFFLNLFNELEILGADGRGNFTGNQRRRRTDGGMGDEG